MDFILDWWQWLCGVPVIDETKLKLDELSDVAVTFTGSGQEFLDFMPVVNEADCSPKS